MYRAGETRGGFDLVVSALQSEELAETMTKIKGSSGFGREPIDTAISGLGESISPLISAKLLEKFWNFNKNKIAELFTYNPIERYPELETPNEDRIDATAFSVALASVMKPSDEITLITRIDVPLVDNLGAYLPTGKLIIRGATGDGVAHHADSGSRIIVDATGDNLGFGSHEDAIIYASSSVGDHVAPNVKGPIPTLLRLHE